MKVLRCMTPSRTNSRLGKGWDQGKDPPLLIPAQPCLEPDHVHQGSELVFPAELDYREGPLARAGVNEANGL